MLMAVEKGNLADVRAALGRDLEVGDIVDYAPDNPLLAQLVPGCAPHWHLLETHPNRERTAASHLIARRFGIFIPEIEETVVRRGRKFDRTRLMFTGYIFVFVWNLESHMDRIRGIPGVARLVSVDGKPATLSDEQIDQIRAVENRERPLTMLMDDAEELVAKKKRKRWRKAVRELAEAEIARGNEVVSVRAWSPFQDDLLKLDREGRNQTLLKALSLSS